MWVCTCILWIVACTSVDDIIFVHVLVLTLVQVLLYSPLPWLPNGHCARYSLGFVVAAGSALRPFTISDLAPSVVDYYLSCLYVCLYGTNILCGAPLAFKLL